jgi:ABC-2 type transport system ATP-binding protein
LNLTVRNLAKAYGYFWALRDVNLQIAGGSCVAVLGPNGAGKSTFLKLISGLICPTEGEVELNGKTLTQAADQFRSAIGFLAPAEHLYGNLTVRENLELFISLYNRRANGLSIDEALENVGLGPWTNDFVSVLSSGMKCRLSIAKWRLLKPGLLLLDEPYGVLDGSGIDLLETFLKAHCQQGNIVLIASHHVSRVLQLCDRALILDQGKLIFDEPRQQPWDSFQRAFADFLPRGQA